MTTKDDIGPQSPNTTKKPTAPSFDNVTRIAERLPQLPLNAEGLEQRLTQLRQLSKRELSVINLRVDDAVTASLAAARTVQRLLPRLRALGGFKPELATRVEEWAYVLNHVHTQANLEPARYRFPTALIAEAKQLRSKLLFEAQYLTAHGLLFDSRITSISKSKAFSELLRDLSLLVQILDADRATWSRKSALEGEQVDRAKAVALLLHAALLQKEAGRANEWIDLKVRAFTMLRRAYDEARASVMYLLRDEPNADRMIPPLTASRKRTARRKRERARLAAVAAVSEAVITQR
jgi:hypothetical protein